MPQYFSDTDINSNRKSLLELTSFHGPFGPEDADHLEVPEVSKLYFDKDNGVYENFCDVPSLVLGRKGSGKTSYLKFLEENPDFNFPYKIGANSAIEKVLPFVNPLNEVSGSHVETVAGLWEKMFWIIIFLEIYQSPKMEEEKSKEYVIIGKYLSSVRENPKTASIDIFEDAMKNHKLKGIPSLFPDISVVLIDLLRGKSPSYEDAVSASISILQNSKSKSIILIDTIDDYKIDQSNINRTDCLRGLLRCLYNFRARFHDVAEVRMCFPTEYYFELRSISSDVIRDFSSRQFLHWKAGEIMEIVARRLLLYLAENKSPLFNILSEYNIHNRHDRQEFFKKLLPQFIDNKLGQEELTVAYLLRHSQLLPRQIISYLNACFKQHPNIKNISVSEDIVPTSKMIVQAVTNLETDISSAICSSFQSKYPKSEDLVKKSLANVGKVFDDADLERVHRQELRGMLNKDEPLYEYDEFRNMMIEMGVIGAKFKEDTGYYINARFEYTEDSKLIINPRDIFCVHPIFSGAYQKNIPFNVEEKSRTLVVYPYGTEEEF